MNVNNLNGVPNFGYGFPEEEPVTEETPEPEEEVKKIHRTTARSAAHKALGGKYK